jgi:predicted RNase H-like HicB family nuclease
MQDSAHETTAVYLEVGRKRVFACAQDWPGWCRSGKTEEQALEALNAYAEQYASVARQAGLPFPSLSHNPFTVVERLAGSAGYTDFGVPGMVATCDREQATSEEIARQLALLRAAWVIFDRIAAITPAELRKGPRGGGRDRSEVIEHVLGAEAAYARRLGVQQSRAAKDDASAIAALRGALVAALRASAAAAPPESNHWPPRSAIRRIAWHVLDHAWEMEDRSGDR